MKTTLVLFLWFYSITVAFSQEKVFLPSEDSYVSILNHENWYANDSGEYFGEYEFIYPAQDEYGEFVGDGYSDILYISGDYSGENLLAYTYGEVEGWNEPIIDTLQNARIECEGEMQLQSNCFLNSDKLQGEFVLFEYKTNTGSKKIVRGILVVNTGEESDYFYEKKNKSR